MRRSPAVTRKRADRCGSAANSSRRCAGGFTATSSAHSGVPVMSTVLGSTCSVPIAGDPTCLVVARRWGMPQIEHFDAIVIGAGQAGPGIANHLVSTGERVALIEQDKVGGTCLNRGCRPTKAMRASARVAHLARTARRHGVHTGDVTVDFGAVMARKDALIDTWVNGYTDSLSHTDGLTLLHGQGRFAGSSSDGHEVAVGDRAIVAPRVFLNVGTRATEPGIPGLDTVPWLDNDRVLHLDELPAHLVVLGGSYIALETGQMFGRFGSAVTIIERSERIASREDPDVSDEIARFLTTEGIALRTSTAVERIEATSSRHPGPHRVGPSRSAGRRLTPARGDRSHAEHRPARPRQHRTGDRRARLLRDRRALPHCGRRRLGARRHQRPGRIHPHLVPGLRDPGRPPDRRARGPRTPGSRRMRCSPTPRSGASA